MKFILQYQLVSPEYELHRDEFLHLDQGKHLAWGYLSLPPFTAWLSYIVGLLGYSEFWVRFFPANLLFDSIYLAGKIQNEYAREYGSAVYLLLGAKKGVNEIIEMEIKKKQTRN